MSEHVPAPVSRRPRPWLALLFVLGAAAAPALAQTAPEQTIWLKNGGFLRGTLVELAPGDHVTVQLVTGEIRRVPAADIDRMSSTSASKDAPAPTPPASAVAPPPAPAPPPSGASLPPAASSVPRDAAILRLTAPASVVLEGRARLEGGAWTPQCTAPCDRSLVVIDREFRVAGEGVTPSRTFVIEPGERPLRLAVDPGSAAMHRWGTRAYLVGTPLLLLGGTGIGLELGTRVENREVYGTLGIVALVAGGAMLLSSLPLLYAGQTRVKNDRGSQFALTASGLVF